MHRGVLIGTLGAIVLIGLTPGSTTALDAPQLPTPTLTLPTETDPNIPPPRPGTYQGGGPLITRWDTNGAPDTTTYTLEYTNDCTIAPALFDDVEGGINGWSVSHQGGDADWARVKTDSHSPNNSWFANDGVATTATSQFLVSPSVVIGAGNVLSFWHRYDMESGFDGGVVEISTNGGTTWTDLGSAMTQNGYNGFIAAGSPLAGRSVFTDDSGGWIETIANLNAYAKQTVKLRFWQADDPSVPDVGWWVDDISVGVPVTWTSIGSSAAGASGFNWNSPSQVGTDYCLRIRGSASGYEDSSYDHAGPFELVDRHGACAYEPFADVPSPHPFCSDIYWMRVNGISTGTAVGEPPVYYYYPQSVVTRQAMSAFMARLGAANLTPCTEAPFNDVATTHTFCKEIKWMKDNGISTGFAGGYYQPTATVTRQAMSAFMARFALGASGAAALPPCSTAPFNDVEAGHPFCKEIKWMADNGITTGFNGGTEYRPALAVSRQSMAAFMYRIAALLDQP